MPKRKFKFKVVICIEELNAVPFVTEVLFCKIRLRNGGSYSASTQPLNVSSHSVHWHQRFEFDCKISCDTNSGTLNPCIARLSVRKEVRGGKSSSKIGFVDINLAEFAGSSQRKKHCLLGGYKDKIRLDNSILKIMISMQLMSGDPLFKIPISNTQEDASFQMSIDSSSLMLADCNNASGGAFEVSRGSSKLKHNDPSNSNKASGTYHNSDMTGDCSESSDHQFFNHSSSNFSPNSSHKKCLAQTQCDTGLHEVMQSRLDDTRVDAKDIVNKLIESHDFNHTSNANDGDNFLQLFIGSDGSKALGGQNFPSLVESGVFHPVVFDKEIQQDSK